MGARKLMLWPGVLALTLGAAGTLAIESASAQEAAIPACASAQAHSHGCGLTMIKGPGTNGPGTSASKTGRACAFNLLRLIAVGDVRISTAKRNGGITQVSSVDYDTFELVPYYGVFSRYCTVVAGN